METIALTPADISRFWAKVKKTKECWEWQGTPKFGYGRFLSSRDADGRQKAIRAHRLAYQLMVGPIPEGLILDHACRNRLCVNPEHLRPVTNKQNMENQSRISANSISGYRGVYWNARDRRWSVAVGHHGKLHHGGYFTDLREAVQAAKDLRNELFTHNDADRAA
jgi:hypothetical protein